MYGTGILNLRWLTMFEKQATIGLPYTVDYTWHSIKCPNRQIWTDVEFLALNLNQRSKTLQGNKRELLRRMLNATEVFIRQYLLLFYKVNLKDLGFSSSTKDKLVLSWGIIFRSLLWK